MCGRGSSFSFANPGLARSSSRKLSDSAALFQLIHIANRTGAMSAPGEGKSVKGGVGVGFLD